MTRQRFVIVSAVLAIQAVLVYGVSLQEVTPKIRPLSEVPYEIGSWKVVAETPLDPGIENYLRPDEYFSRQYEAPNKSNIELFVAWFKSLNQSYGPHSPRICLPGSGWLTRKSVTTQIHMPGWPEPVDVNEIYMEKGSQKILVLYWYQNQRHAYADEVAAKLYLLPDMLRHHRADVALVRLIAPGEPGQTEVRDRTVEFSKQIFPFLVDRFRD